MQPFQQLQAFHDSVMQFKSHLVDNHGQRDMVPCIMCVFRDAGPIPADLSKVAFAAISEKVGIDLDVVVKAFLEGMFATTNEVMQWAMVEYDEKDESDENLRNIILHVVRGTGALNAAVQRRAKDDDKLMSLWIAVDEYFIEGDTIDNPEFLLQGGMKHDFESNPETQVSEGITSMVLSDDLCGGADVQIMTHPYTVTDGGKIRWDDEAFRHEDIRIGPGESIALRYGEIQVAVSEAFINKMVAQS